MREEVNLSAGGRRCRKYSLKLTNSLSKYDADRQDVAFARERVQSGAEMKSFDEFLSSLPILSVGQHHSAQFECDAKLDAKLDPKLDPKKVSFLFFHFSYCFLILTNR